MTALGRVASAGGVGRAAATSSRAVSSDEGRFEDRSEAETRTGDLEISQLSRRLAARHTASRGDTSRSILADASRSAARKSYAACTFIQKSGELPK